ncbi:hypothetical protein SSX86_008958 [Deinandra increscens subsp. villosa]|uniref:Leucine-rich repeat-containing N-terminal plant-type domain-containing protein n=1 Tax=Deinandra increscens subsp. villosa TaxID=3103831 RepID=A0AAP0H4G5_9ASTR
MRLVFLFISSLIVLAWFKTTTATSLHHHTSNYKCIDKERHALLHFKSYVHHDPGELLSTWTNDEEAIDDCCEWFGVTCNKQTGHVTTLDLRYGDLEGKISPSLLNLSYLNHLDLFGNYFNGTIPMFIGSMTQLRYLDLGRNDFSGIVPLEFGNLTNLQVLLLRNLRECTIENLDWLSHLSLLEDLEMSSISLAKVDNWVNVILSLKKLSTLRFDGCDLSHVVHPYSFPFVNSSSSSIVSLDLGNNNLNSSMFHWLFPLTSNKLEELDLSMNKLDEIPKYLQNLCSLTSLSFHFNSMPINFSDFLNNLSGCTSFALQKLDASSSQFKGSFSDEIQKFSSLVYLLVSNNHLTGTISEKVWQLPSLKKLDVSSNSLKGVIPEYIGNSKLLFIDLSNNLLEGVPFEAHMSNLSFVEEIDLSSCKLGPHFPKWVQALKNLSSIDISNTGISDTIPKEFWYMWPSGLTYLNLSSNNITGQLKDLLSNFNSNSESSTLDLSSNNFYGPIPNVSSTLQWLDLSKNKLNGEINFVCQIFDGSLFFLDLSHNSFTGQIPDCLWHFKELKLLSLGHNNLFGRIPTSIEYLINLEVLYLYNNSFSGELPLSLKSCTNLTFLELGANNFSGDVPAWIGEKLLELYALSLTSNNFFGTIPSQICHLVELQILDLSDNKLYGTIPSCLNNLTSMIQNNRFSSHQNVHYFNFSSGSEYVDHAMIKWQGRLREFGINLGLVKLINLSRNNLTGKIPNELTDLHDLIALDLSMNALIGEIPSKIGQMKELLILDLSRNNLSRSIPSSMSNMTLLNYLDVSYNNLSGRIPLGTQLQSFEPSRYIGNAGLCGLPMSKYCPGDKELEVPPVIDKSEDDGQDIDDLQRWFYIGGATGFAMGFVIVCGALLVNRHGRHTFFHFLDVLEDWVYVKVMLSVVKIQRVEHP